MVAICRFRPIFRSPSISSAAEKDTQINRIINKSDDGDNGIQQFGDQKALDEAYLPRIMTIEYPSVEERVRASMSHQNGADDDMSQVGGAFNGADNNGQVDAAEYDSYQNDT